MNPDNYPELDVENLPSEWDKSIGEEVVETRVQSYQVEREGDREFMVRLWFTDLLDEALTSYWETTVQTEMDLDLRLKASKRKLMHTARKKMRDEIDECDEDYIGHIYFQTRTEYLHS